MRTLWSIRPLICLADVAMLRCTTLGPQGPFPPTGRGGGHSFAVAVAMPTFTLLVVAFIITPANRQALASLAVRCGLAHVPVQLSQVPRLARGRAPRLLVDPRNVWATVSNLRSPASSKLESSAEGCSSRVTESASAPDHTGRAGTAKLSQGQPWLPIEDPSLPAHELYSHPPTSPRES